MNAKFKFREGWIMLNRPFKFGELKQPLQKMTVLYAFSEKPILEMTLNLEGQKEYKKLLDAYGHNNTLSNSSQYCKYFKESQEEYENRIDAATNLIFKTYGTQEEYKGEIVQSIIEGEICRFYPDEYTVIKPETLDHLLTCDDQEYIAEINDNTIFTTQDMRNKIFYIRSRGIPNQKAVKMVSKEAKDCVIFRPQPALLEMFCRPNEIY